MQTTATILDGRAVAAKVMEQAAARVAAIQGATGITPGLATVLVGADPASVTYTRMKRKRAEAAGMKSVRIELPDTAGTDDVLETIDRLNRDEHIHGILLQHPVPKQVDERRAFDAIRPQKDVDGVTTASFGAMAFGGEGFASCTPGGIMTLLGHYGIDPLGRRAVVIGRSPILGKPMAMLLLAAHATVTICHSRTRDLPEVVREADLLVAAVGRPRFVQGDWIRPGAVVVDAGYNEGNIGDVDYDACAAKAGWITPVPGGVGPMTIATLISQTATAAARQLDVSLDD